MKFSRVQFLSTIFVLSLYFIGCSEANDSSQKAGEIISNFLNVSTSHQALPESLFLSERQPFEKVVASELVSEKSPLKGSYSEDEFNNSYDYHPWFAEHIFLKHGLPDIGVLHRWGSKVSVGYGWPLYRVKKPRNAETSGARQIQMFPESYKYVQASYQLLESELERLTNLDLSFVEPTDEIEYTADFAKIRIIPVEGLKRRASNNIKSIQWDPIDYETKLWSAVPFANANWEILDGYIISGEDNSIKLAICKVRADLGTFLFKQAVSECLIRSLGLTGYLENVPSSLLYNWRRHSTESDQEMPAIPDYDQVMLRLLYCDALASGMDKLDVLKVLINKKCNL